MVDVATGESAEVMLEAIEDELDDAGEGDEECEQTVEGRGKKPVIRLHKVFPREHHELEPILLCSASPFPACFSHHAFRTSAI